MAPTPSSQHAAIGNQSNHNSTQVNAPLFVSCGTFSLTKSDDPDALKSDSVLNFAVGFPPEIDKELLIAKPLEVPPTIKASHQDDISREQFEIGEKYRWILRTSKPVKHPTKIGWLKKIIKDQHRMVRSICERILRNTKSWPLIHQNESEEAAEDTFQASDASNQLDQILVKLRAIKSDLHKGVETIKFIKREHQTRRMDKSDYEQLHSHIDSAQTHITELDSQANALLAGPAGDVTSTTGFNELHLASLVTRTLYNCLCTSACPRASSGEPNGEHSHRALLGLVPDVPPTVAEQSFDLAAHIAIQSTVNKSSHIWFRADLHKPELNSPSPKPSNEYGEWKVGGEIQVCPGSLAQGSDGLAMRINDSQGGLHRIYYVHSGRLPQDASSFTLSSIIEEGQRKTLVVNPRDTQYSRSCGLRKYRSLVAVRIVEAAMTFGWRDWLSNGLNSSNIVFYRFGSTFEAFMTAQMVENARTRRGRFMQDLGIVLLEVGLWQCLRKTDTPDPSKCPRVQKACQELVEKTAEEYYEAVWYCLRFKEPSQDNNDSEDASFQASFYQKVVSPLKAYAAREVDIHLKGVNTTYLG